MSEVEELADEFVQTWHGILPLAVLDAVVADWVAGVQ